MVYIFNVLCFPYVFTSNISCILPLLINNSSVNVLVYKILLWIGILVLVILIIILYNKYSKVK